MVYVSVSHPPPGPVKIGRIDIAYRAYDVYYASRQREIKGYVTDAVHYNGSVYGFSPVEFPMK